jgi:transposase InsO family protein
VTNSPRWREDEAAIEMALFRYGIIAPILELDPASQQTVGELVDEITARPYHLHSRGRVSVRPRTVYAWLALYRRHGIQGLRSKWREDRGCQRVLKTEVIERAIALRRENPRRKTRTLIDIMKREGTLCKEVPFHRATLDRHLVHRGASRRQMKVLAAPPTIKMEFEKFGDLWVGDYHHGPLVRAPGDRVVTAKIGALIDHATRYPVSNRYYLDERLDTLRDGMLRALLRWGTPKRIYVDRGAVYRSDQLEYSLRRIGVHLIHSRAYYSKGRGVIERWWQFLKDFESEVTGLDRLITIHELNQLWEAYRELNYCQQVHSEIGCTPAEAIAKVTRQGLEPDVAAELFLVRETRKVHRETSCVPILTREFLCDSSLRGQEVDVRFDPNDLTSVVIFKDDRRIQKAFPRTPNASPQRPIVPEKLTPSVDYLSLVREDYDRQLLEHARPLAYAKLEVEAEFDEEAFVGVVVDLSGLALRPGDRREVATFWQTFGPLPETLVRIGIEHAVRLHGRGRHVRVYLTAVRTLVLAHWRGPAQEEDR